MGPLLAQEQGIVVITAPVPAQRPLASIGPQGLKASLPYEALSRRFNFPFFFFFPPPQVSIFTVAEPQIHRLQLGHSTALSCSIAAYFSSTCLALSTIRTIRAFGSDRQQLAGTAGLFIAGTCIALLFIRWPPFLSPTVTNALPTHRFSNACSGAIEAIQLGIWR